jgi:O-antigen biosynthesis protein
LADLARRLARATRRRLPGAGASARPKPTTAGAGVGSGVRDRIRVPLIAAPAGRRLDLVIPALDPASTFGGIRTALDLLEALAPYAPRRRIISRAAVSPEVAASFGDWTMVPAADGGDDVERSIVSLADAAGTGLAVGPDDVFVGTFWPTAAWIRDVRRWQIDTFGRMPGRFGYLIQDYEPGFYPRSAQSLLARATYDDPTGTVAIFNTDLLRTAFEAEGITFEHAFAFEPRLAPVLEAARRRPPVERSRRIVVYGRPSKPRNGFPLIVDGLRAWVAATPDAERWTVVSAGEAHAPVELGRGVRLASVGKLGLDGYADLLRTSAIGVSLMISPHPSYPPLEMAALGMLVLTNRFGPKDLATWHDNIVSLGDVEPEAIGRDLAALTARFDADPRGGDAGRALRPDWLDAAGPAFPFAAELARRLGLSI